MTLPVFIPPPHARSGLPEMRQLQEQLATRLGQTPRRWVGKLRRMSLARNIRSSNSIEGFEATLDEALLAVDGAGTGAADDATARAVEGYRDAMTYVLQLQGDRHTTVDASLLRALHFMMTKGDLDGRPGLWRTGDVYVRDEQTGEIVYMGPSADDVPALIDVMLDDLVRWEREGVDPFVVGAIAHLNLAMIHPFKDGNGRMARCLQTLMLVRAGIGSPVFCSIEEYLGQHTRAYYDVLADVGGGRWQPARSCDSWIVFCLNAHVKQLGIVSARIARSELLWRRCAELVRARGLPERSIGVLWDAARGLSITRSGYADEVRRSAHEEIGPSTAQRDLQLLVVAGLLEVRGKGRGAHYRAQEALENIWYVVREEISSSGLTAFEALPGGEED